MKTTKIKPPLHLTYLGETDVYIHVMDSFFIKHPDWETNGLFWDTLAPDDITPYLHRLDGPAIEYISNNYRRYFILGKYVDVDNDKEFHDYQFKDKLGDVLK